MNSGEQMLAEKVCKCGLRTRLVGDGCEVCNPALALSYAQDQIVELERDVARYENSRIVQALENQRLRESLARAEAERDQYKMAAEMNAETIREMQRNG